MSFTQDPQATRAVPPSVQGNATLTVIIALVVPVVTIAGLIVLIALSKIDQSAGLSLIGVLAGVHGGAVVANASNR